MVIPVVKRNRRKISKMYSKEHCVDAKDVKNSVKTAQPLYKNTKNAEVKKIFIRGMFKKHQDEN